MARTTKKELISIIFNILTAHPEKEVCIVKYQNKLRNGRWGMHAYALAYNCEWGEVVCRPWAGAEAKWSARLERLNKDELQDIVGKCMMLTHP